MDVQGNVLHPGAVLKPGQQLTMTGSGFTAGENVDVVVASTPVTVTSALADAGGSVTATFVLPANLAVGSHTVTLQGASAQAVFPFRVIASSLSSANAADPTGTLAHTGAAVAPMAGLGAALVALGCAAIAWARRRPRHHRAH
jgi:IPT/TIG domain